MARRRSFPPDSTHRPPPAPAPFERQLTALQEKGGRPLTRGELAALQPATPLAPVRLVGSRTAATVPAGSATRGSGPTILPVPAGVGLAERERALQQSVLPSGPPPRANVSARPPPDTIVYAPPAA